MSDRDDQQSDANALWHLQPIGGVEPTPWLNSAVNTLAGATCTNLENMMAAAAAMEIGAPEQIALLDEVAAIVMVQVITARAMHLNTRDWRQITIDTMAGVKARMRWHLMNAEAGIAEYDMEAARNAPTSGRPQ